MTGPNPTRVDRPHTRDAEHCDHWQDGDGDCCECGAPNWCPDAGEDFAERIPAARLAAETETP